MKNLIPWVRFPAFSVILLAAIALLPATRAGAFWVENGTSIAAETNNQSSSYTIEDGAGGVIIIWQDGRNGSGDIYAQRMDSYGRALWTAGGIRLTTTPASDLYAVSDHEGGVIFCWTDFRNGNNDIFAQRIDGDGSELWTSGGSPVCTDAGIQDYSICCWDGYGGAVFAWNDLRDGNYDIYAQRKDVSGTDIWTSGGEGLVTTNQNQNDVKVAVDAANSVAYFAWADSRTGYYDIYAQKYTLSGTRVWAVNGMAICTATNNQSQVEIGLDGYHDLVLAWTDFRNTNNYQIYAQILDQGGSALLTANGIPVLTSAGDQTESQLIACPEGGMVVTFEDDLGLSTSSAYAQKISRSGSQAWTSGGVRLCSGSWSQSEPCVLLDGEGGAYFCWGDARAGGNNLDLYLQRVSGDGTILWDPDGVPVVTAARNQYTKSLAGDGFGGLILSFWDRRNGTDYDLYAQRIERNGYWGYPCPYIESVIDVPGDQGGSVSVGWEASRIDAWPEQSITRYSIWRAIDQQAAAMMSGEGILMLTAGGGLEIDPERDVIRREILDGTTYYWKLVTYQDAYSLPDYGEVVATLFDSTEVNDDYHYFQVIAHTDDSRIFWISPPDSGYSVDNLAPAAPLGLAGEQLNSPEPGIELTWDPNAEIDLAGYKIYRGLSESFVPAPDNFITFTPDTMTFDTKWHWNYVFWYKVSAIDIHGNESLFASLSPAEVTGDDIPEVPAASFLKQNYPNPFNPVTRISFGLSEAGYVSLRVYDPAGRLVRVLVGEDRPAGTYEAVWDGRGDSGKASASGVYFYSLEAGTFRETRKMILLR